jgi:flagellar operon protein
VNAINGPGGSDLRRIGGPGQAGRPGGAPPGGARGAEFGKILREEAQRNRDVKLSGHALARLQTRSISLGPDDMDRLRDAVDRAEAKGAREALVLMSGPSREQDLAFVVSVRNRTVITAMEGDSMKDNVFTNIDSAVDVR